MRVKPSRGTVAFFVLLIVGGFVKYGIARHDRASFVEDAPAAQTARRLLRCLLGSDSERLLGERSTASVWADRATDRLRRVAMAQFSTQWPSRCEPLAQHLVERLGHTPASTTVASAAENLNGLIGRVSRERIALLDAVESGVLGAAIAGMANEVSAMSAGAGAEWDLALRATATDLVLAPDAVTPLVPWPLTDDALLPLPDLVLFQSPATRTAHRMTFDAHEHPTTHPLARGAPVTGTDAEGARWIADDLADSLFLPEGEPASVIPLPAVITRGDAVVQTWQTALTSRRLWLLTLEGGRVRVRATPRTGEVAWGEPIAALGESESLAGAALSVTSSANEQVVVEAVQRGGNGVSVVRWRIDAEPSVIVHPPEVMAAEWPAFDVHVQTCVRGDSRTLLVMSDDALARVELSGERVRFDRLAFRDIGRPTGDRLDLACSAAGVTVLMATERGNVLLVSNGDASSWETLAPPSVTSHLAIVGAVPTDHAGVVVLGDDGNSLRAFRHTVRVTDEGARESVWDGGTLLAVQTYPTVSTDANLTDVVSMASAGDQVAALVRVRIGVRGPQWGRLASRDGGRTWHGLE